ncbi:hypothetical protein AAG570_002740 [Ranatra chinensis]|uniref:Uncharacterized protein n=1 Tax=Ranatra chinensis TaxID=642074 RepID=A0ABD0YAH1_9HEMI
MSSQQASSSIYAESVRSTCRRCIVSLSKLMGVRDCGRITTLLIYPTRSLFQLIHQCPEEVVAVGVDRMRGVGEERSAGVEVRAHRWDAERIDLRGKSESSETSPTSYASTSGYVIPSAPPGSHAVTPAYDGSIALASRTGGSKLGPLILPGSVNTYDIKY